MLLADLLILVLGTHRARCVILRVDRSDPCDRSASYYTTFPVVSARLLLGWTRFGSPGIFGYSGG